MNLTPFTIGYSSPTKWGVYLRNRLLYSGFADVRAAIKKVLELKQEKLTRKEKS